MVNDCLIMAGGSGTRLWPASSSRKPKQFLSMSSGGGQSFFSSALERAFSVIAGDDGRVIVIAGKSHIPLVITACEGLGLAEKKRLLLIPEPEAKNTAPAIACAIAYSLKAGGPNRTMMVLTSDHIIRPLERFTLDAAVAADFSRQGKLAVFGIPPVRPETGFGYIETSQLLPADGAEVYAVAAFREKPDRKTAENFIALRRFFWNSGMFVFTTELMAGEFRRLAAGVIHPFEQLAAPDENSYTQTQGLRILSNWAGLENAYRQAQSVSFDYAIAEKCSQTIMVRAGFDWIDIGNWEDYAALLGDTGSEVYCVPPGAPKNGGTAAAAQANLPGCFVDSDIPVALAGVDDLIVVIRSGKDGAPAAALITRKGETQHVRDIVDQIKKADRADIL